MFKALAAASLLAWSLSAGAAPPEKPVTLTTGMMHVPVSAGAYHLCSVQNVSAAPLSVTIEVMDGNGSVESKTSSTLNAGISTFVYSTGSYVDSSCRFTFQGSPNSVRASICNWQNYSCVSHLEAR